MKEGWTYKKLGEVCETLNGLWKGRKPPFVNVGVIRNANFTKDFTLRYDNVEYLDVEEKQYVKRKLQRGDLIIEKSGGSEKQPVGRAVLFDKENGEFSFSNFTSVLRVKNDILQSRFLYIYLLFIYKRGDTLKMQKATTGIHNIEFDKYLNIDIPILPFAQQQRIVSHLDAAFAHIDALKVNADKQLAEARQLFQAELAECMRPKEGWEEMKFTEVCDIITDFVAAGSFADLRKNVVYNEAPDYAQLVRTTDLKHNFENKSFVYVSEHAFNYLWRVNLNEESIILPNVGVNCGEVYYVNPNKLPYKCNVLGPNAILVRSHKYDNLFLSYLFKGKEMQTQLRHITSSMAQPKYNKTNLKNLMVSLPSLEIQRSIVSRLDALSANIKKLEELQRKTLAECDALKQAMLREVFE